MKHRWTDQECLVVCTIFKNEFVDSNDFVKSIDSVVQQIEMQCPLLSAGSIKMKISNTVAICNEERIVHSCSIASLSHYSQQHRKAFKEVFGV